MQSLSRLNTRVQSIAAPRAGYIAAIDLKVGDTYDGVNAAFCITTADAMPVFRVDLSEVERSVSEGTDVTISTLRYGDIITKVVDVAADEEGKRYADVQITQDMLEALGSVYSLTLSQTPMKIIYRARESSCLVPASAVRGSGSDRYVYVGVRESSTFGGSQIKCQKMAVTVLGESGSTVSVAEDLTYQQVLYMEDRTLSENAAVMSYEGS